VKNGICSICETGGALTMDHVPPRGIVAPSRLKIASIIEKYGLPKFEGHPGRESAEFRTLCRDCNGKRLGSEFDPALKALARRADSWLRARRLGLSLPGSMTLELVPQRVARSVIGHLLASARVELGKVGSSAPPMSRAMRDYFLSPNQELPASLSIYVWPYIATRQVIIPAFLKAQLGIKDGVIGCLLKFYPLAFWVVFDPERVAELKLTKLVPADAKSLDDVRDLTLSLQRIPPVDWPEAPGRSEFVILTTAGSSIADPAGGLGGTF
jgi:hypothetical protein